MSSNLAATGGGPGATGALPAAAMQQNLLENRIDKKEQAKSLRQLQDMFELGDFQKGIKFCNLSKHLLCSVNNS